MSDFGTMILVRRRDAANVGEADRATLERALAPLRAAGAHVDVMGEAMKFRLGEAVLEAGERGFSVLLSEYWLEMEDDEPDFDPDALLAEDAPVARAALDALRERLGEGYALELIVDHW